jgi:hypothetical protein
LILSPAIVVSGLAWLFSDQVRLLNEMPSWLWLVLIVGIDAGHVYSTLFRTYLVREELQHRQALLTLAPLAAWLIGCLLYSFDGLLFWRVLAYLAVFHFIRQQYGFMMIYARHERNRPVFYRSVNKAAIYIATLYPIIFWHCQPRAFNWFIENDFISVNSPLPSRIAGYLYWLILSVYLLKELYVWITEKQINVPRNLLLGGTVLSWYVGIVAFDNDLIFTACNVIAHGIPYYALIWAYGYKQTIVTNGSHKGYYVVSWISKVVDWKTVPIFIAFMVVLAFVEEGLWDGLIWRDHLLLFGVFKNLPAISSLQIQMWLVPLLSVPQTTHYLLDAFIWRLHGKDTPLRDLLFK